MLSHGPDQRLGAHNTTTSADADHSPKGTEGCREKGGGGRVDRVCMIFTCSIGAN